MFCFAKKLKSNLLEKNQLIFSEAFFIFKPSLQFPLEGPRAQNLALELAQLYRLHEGMSL